VCDVLEPWAHGTVVRATRHPSYYDFNLIRVEDDAAMSVDALVGFADEALAGLEHRRVDFDLLEAAEPLRHGFKEAGWRCLRLLVMRHETAPPPGPVAAIEEVPYDAAHDLRVAWHREVFPDKDAGDYHGHVREISLRLGARVARATAGTRWLRPARAHRRRGGDHRGLRRSRAPRRRARDGTDPGSDRGGGPRR